MSQRTTLIDASGDGKNRSKRITGGFRRLGGFPRAPSASALRAALMCAPPEKAAAILWDDLDLEAQRQTRREEFVSDRIDDLHALHEIAEGINWLPSEHIRPFVDQNLRLAFGLSIQDDTGRLFMILSAAYAFADQIADNQAQEIADIEAAARHAAVLEKAVGIMKGAYLTEALGISRRRYMASEAAHAETASHITTGATALEELAERLRSIEGRVKPGRRPELARFCFLLRLVEAFVVSTGRMVALSEPATTSPKAFIRFAHVAMRLTGMGQGTDGSLDDILRRQIGKGVAPGKATELWFRESLEELAAWFRPRSDEGRVVILNEGWLPSVGLAIDLMGAAANFEPSTHKGE